ncbi:MAG: GMC family oxidoreductase [Chthoniobacteraceae bacterium]
MKLTAEAFLPNASARRFDVCIIGSGAAGLCIANELALTGASVVLLEAGRHRDDEESQSCYAVELPELEVFGATQGRFRVPGGSTTRWAGQALPLDPGDFEARPWVPFSGWPIGYREVERYYRQAAAFMFVDEMDYQEHLASTLGARIAAFDPSVIRHQFSKFSLRPDLRLSYLPKLEQSANVTVVTGANMVSLNLSGSSDTIESVSLVSYAGLTAKMSASKYVLCCGAIENARLLLASRDHRSAGVGNEHGLVGRFFQDHPGCHVGTIASRDPDTLQDLFNIYYRKGMRYKPRFSPSPELQGERRILNISGVLLFEQKPDSAFAVLRDAARDARKGRISLPKLAQVFGGIGELGQLTQFVWSRFSKGRHYNPNAEIRLAFSAEQEPDPESRIMLSTKANDRFGMPLAVVQWRLTESVARTIWEFSHVVADEMRRLRLGEVVFYPWMNKDFATWKDSLRDNNHHIGTTRMGAKPEDGVVDGDCRVHSVANLYIAGSSVFPTGGHSNPTLTLLALAMRLADHLKQ